MGTPHSAGDRWGVRQPVTAHYLQPRLHKARGGRVGPAPPSDRLASGRGAGWDGDDGSRRSTVTNPCPRSETGPVHVHDVWVPRPDRSRLGDRPHRTSTQTSGRCERQLSSAPLILSSLPRATPPSSAGARLWSVSQRGHIVTAFTSRVEQVPVPALLLVFVSPRATDHPSAARSGGCLGFLGASEVSTPASAASRYGVAVPDRSSTGLPPRSYHRTPGRGTPSQR